MPFVPRPVDERDTQWELDELDLRVFVFRPGGSRDVFDADATRLDDAVAWARGRAGYAFAIALRTRDADERPGLIWLVGNTADPERI
jgi:hypothetical protein